MGKPSWSQSAFYLILVCYISVFSLHEFTCEWHSVSALSVTGDGWRMVRETEQTRGWWLSVHRLASSFGVGISDCDAGGGGAELWSHLPVDCIWIREDGKRIMLQFSYFWNSSMNQFIVSDVKLLFTENLFLKDWSMRMATPKCFLAYVLPKPSTIWPILLIQDNKC